MKLLEKSAISTLLCGLLLGVSSSLTFAAGRAPLPTCESQNFFFWGAFSVMEVLPDGKLQERRQEERLPEDWDRNGNRYAAISLEVPAAELLENPRYLLELQFQEESELAAQMRARARSSNNRSTRYELELQRDRSRYLVRALVFRRLLFVTNEIPGTLKLRLVQKVGNHPFCEQEMHLGGAD